MDCDIVIYFATVLSLHLSSALDDCHVYVALQNRVAIFNYHTVLLIFRRGFWLQYQAEIWLSILR